MKPNIKNIKAMKKLLVIIPAILLVSTQAHAPVVDVAKANINATVIYTPSAISESNHLDVLEYSPYKIVNNAIVIDMVVEATSVQRGEAGGFSGTDKAYIFENGKLLATKTVNDVVNDQSIKAAYSKYDWPYAYDGDLGKFYPDRNPTHLTFQGKTVSNYVMIMPVAISKDQTKLYAAGMEAGDKGTASYFFTMAKRIK